MEWRLSIFGSNAPYRASDKHVISTLLLSIFTAEAIESNYVDILLHSFKYIFILFGFLCIIALFASLMRGKENVKE